MKKPGLPPPSTASFSTRSSTRTATIGYRGGVSSPNRFRSAFENGRSQANAFPATEIARERLAFDKAFIGSCTNGGYGDLLEAALVLKAARAKGVATAAKEFVVFPGSGGVKREIEKTDPRLGGESIAAVFRAAGAVIRESWCGPCFGQGPDALSKGETAITSFNRNWTNRMGVGGLGYLASPAVVASSALLGYMGPPSELGIEWRAERFV